MRPMTRFSVFVLVGMLCAVPAAAQFQSVGSLEFRTSTKSAEAQQYFLRGVAILHSFGWKQAIEQFQAAQELDPDFVLAYWGETLCYNHPLFGGPTPDEDNPRAVLARLGSSREERLEKAPTDREKGFLTAVETLWAREGTYDERRVAYMEAMADLHERYPDDHEGRHLLLDCHTECRPRSGRSEWPTRSSGGHGRVVGLQSDTPSTQELHTTRSIRSTTPYTHPLPSPQR